MASISICYFAVSPKSHFSALTCKPLKPSQFHYFAPLESPVIPRGRRLSCGKASVSLITASSSSGSGSSNADVVTTSASRPGGRVESDKLPKDVRERAMAAIDSSGRRVTIGDVASKAGLKLSEAQKALQALAADANGFLEVIFWTLCVCTVVLKHLFNNIKLGCFHCGNYPTYVFDDLYLTGVG